MVPNGWEVKSPSKLFKLFSGFAFKSSDAKESGAKWLKIANVGIGEIKWDADSFLPEHFLLEHKKYLLTKGDIVVALTRPTLGNKLKVARLTKDSDTSLLNQRVAKIVCKDNVDSEFTFQVLRSDQFAFRINVGLLGTDPPNLSVKVLEDFTIPVPPLPEQRKIAQILSTWDRGIATTEKLIDASKQQKKALMQQLLTGKKRLLDPETGKAFEGDWEEVKLDDLALYRRGSFPQPYGNPEWVDEVNGYPFIQVFDIDKNMKLKKATKTKISDAAIDKSVFIEAGTVIVSLQGSIGRVAITQYDAYVDRTVLLFQSFKRKMDTIYFAYAIQELFEIEKEKAPGGTIKTITKQVLSNFTIKVPTHYEQQKIASVLTAADKEIELLGTKLAHLKEEKKALMQQLLTGKRRVKVAETEAA